MEMDDKIESLFEAKFAEFEIKLNNVVGQVIEKKEDKLETSFKQQRSCYSEVVQKDLKYDNLPSQARSVLQVKQLHKPRDNRIEIKKHYHPWS